MCYDSEQHDEDGEYIEVPLSTRESAWVIFLMILVWSGLVTGIILIVSIIYAMLQLATIHK